MAVSVDDGDQVLIAAAKRGEREALDLLARRHDRWVRNVVYATASNSGVVDDIVQNVWTKVCQQIGSLVDPTRWRAWLYKLAKHAAIDAGQRVAHERRLGLVHARVDQTAEGQAGPTEAAVSAETHRRVMAAIRGLPAIYREPFILRHLEDWSYEQIGEAMSLPIDTVETRLVRARRLLRSALQDLDAERKASA